MKKLLQKLFINLFVIAYDKPRKHVIAGLTRNLKFLFSFLILIVFMFFTGVNAYSQSNVSDFTEFNDYWTGNATPPNISLTGDIIFGPALGTAALGLNMTIAGNDRIFDGLGTYSGLNLGSGMSLAINGGITFQNFENSSNGGAIYVNGSNISFSGGSTTFQNNTSMTYITLVRSASIVLFSA
ncbi:MAG: hypothetical protein FWF00_03465 [Endomicrobia bacterium]|nr:hypothetical protein [Endomicrobiia bacterium]MCL2506736.1 hypothetical protein [Endomicrobiia bacterium]